MAMDARTHAEGSTEAALVDRLEHELGRKSTCEEYVAKAERQRLDMPKSSTDIRIHDLRHSFASNAVALG